MMRRVFSIVSNSMITSSKQLKWVGIPQCYQLTNRYQFTSTSGPSQTALLEEVEAKIHHVLRSAAKFKADKLTKTATFEQLGFDSLDTVELVVAMQQYFGLDLPNEQAEKITNVEQAVSIFYKHMNDQIANKLTAEQFAKDVKK